MASERRERWQISDARSCVGLSIYWRLPLDVLQTVVGPGLEPLEGDEPGYGSFGLFAVSGDEAVITAAAPQTSDIGVPTVAAGPPPMATSTAAPTPFAIGAALVPVKAPDDWRGALGEVWTANVETVCPAGHPLAALHRRHGFTVSNGQVLVSVGEDSLGSLASFFIATRGGRVEATAAFSDAGRAWSSDSSLTVGTDPTRLSAFGGAESARRCRQGQATVRSMGDTWLSRLDLPSQPTSAVLDLNFSWDFTFYGPPA